KCKSAPLIVNVPDGRVYPTISGVATINNTSCDATAPNGSLTAPADAGFTYQWYVGASTASPTAPAGALSITNLGPNTYRLAKTNTATGCTSFQDFPITNTPLTITASTTSIVDNTMCIAPYNGSITAAGAGGTGYNYYWYNGNAVKAVADATTATYSNLAIGQYTVVVEDAATKCKSDPLIVNVGDGRVYPVVPAVTTVNNTHCDLATPNGSLAVTTPDNVTYSYQWYTGAGTGSPLAAGATTVSGLGANTYRLVITNNTTGCSSFDDFPIIHTPLSITVSVPAANNTPNTNCSPVTPNGQAIAVAAGGGPAYNYYWYIGSFVKPTPDHTGDTYSSLPAGKYTVVAEDDATKCKSPAIIVTIADQTVLPTIVATIEKEQQHCDPAQPNGILKAIVSAPAGNFAFKWYRGQNTLAANLIAETTAGGEVAGATGLTISNLSKGYYTVVAIHAITKCTSQKEIYLTENLYTPVLNTAVVTDLTICSPANGAISISVNELPGGSATETDKYNFYWFSGNVTNPDTTTALFDGPVYSNLAVGTYTVMAAHKVNRCYSTTQVVEVKDASPEIELTAIKDYPGACTEPEGELTVNVADNNGGLGYIIKLYKDKDHLTDPNNIFVRNPANDTDPGVFSIYKNALPSGNYTAIVIDKATGCEKDSLFNLPYQELQKIEIDPLNITNATTCEVGASSNGSIRFKFTPQSIRYVEDYYFQFYYGDQVTDKPTKYNVVVTPSAPHRMMDGSEQGGDLKALGETHEYVFDNLDPGVYTIIAIDKVTVTADESPCTSVPVYVTVGDDAVAPEIVVKNSTSDNFCDAAEGNGTIEVAVDESGLATPGNAFETTNYQFSWYVGKNITTTPLPATHIEDPAQPYKISKLNSGYYTLVVTDLDGVNQACDSTTFFFVSEDLPALTLETTDYDLANQTDCTPENGSIKINSVSEDGVAIAYDATGFEGGPNYTFEWKNVSGAVIGTGPELTGLAEGSYTVSIVNVESGCVNNGTIIEVDKVVTEPDIALVDFDEDTDCKLGGNGMLQVAVKEGGVNVTAGYTFKWYNSAGTEITLSNTVAGSEYKAINLQAGDYLVEITDNTTPNKGCVSTKLFNVPSEPPVFSLVENIDYVITDQLDCDPTGEIRIDSVKENGISIDYDATGFSGGPNYTFTWTNAGGTAVGTGNEITGLEEGIYTVVIRNESSECTSSPIDIEIKKIVTSPDIVLTDSLADTDCKTAGNGMLQVAVKEGGVNVTAGYTFKWYNSAGTEITLSNTVAGSEYKAINLQAGDYTVEITDNTTPNKGCQTTAVFTVNSNPPIINLIEKTNYTVTDQNDCDPKNGSIVISSIHEDNTVITYSSTGLNGGPNYTFIWTDGSGTVLAETGNTITDKVAGTYRVTATNTESMCNVTADITINNTTVIPSVVLVKEAVDSSCDLAPGLGSGRISASVTEGATAGVTSGYLFQWFIGNSRNASDALPASKIAGASGEIAHHLVAGTYTVVVTDISTPGMGCSSSSFIEVEFKSSKPEIMQMTKLDQMDCNTKGSAAITEMNEDGMASDISDYTFEWYNAGSSLISTSKTPSIKNLEPGTYFVKAMNDNTGCRTDAKEFKILNKIQYPVLEFDILSEQRVCYSDKPSGALKVIADGNPDPNRYTYTWYKQGQPISEGNKIEDNNERIINQVAGLYTVSVTDNVTGCVSVGSYIIQNYLVEPTIFIENLPVTNCDPDKFNGQLTATVKGVTEGYKFEWFVGDKLEGTPINNNVISQLSPGLYTILVTDMDTGCQSDSIVTVTSEALPIGKPDLSLVSGLTSCITPNGVAQASIQGVTDGYIFRWYEGNGTTGIPMEGPTQSNLNIGEYTITATDILTGCTSEAALFTMEDGRVPLDFQIVTTNSECELNNGTAKVVLPDSTIITGMEWNTSLGTYEGMQLLGLPIGEYEVTVINSEGCPTTKSFTIGADVFIRNAVTQNDDRINDIFKISCIEQFQNNKVMIFNRAGALVYEVNGYDNTNVYFDGKPNRGIYLSSEKLPVGTYFYVIDKKDGTEPKTGYLELIR
ncbi:MAG TPA: gliding motility-associated C-terminal domain-containing protein, partial [Cytophagales bacterium]|nr:gliding motility-associated C-terminal domain-containing protein [Cytophagales bacterium]